MFDFLKRLFNVKFASAPLITAPSSVKSKSSTHKLSYNEKELLAVKRTTQQDVLQLTGFPYSWNSPIQKSIEPHGHPFVYMDIVGSNLSVAKIEIEKMNGYIERDKALCKQIPKNLRIPVSEIIFSRSADRGYTRLICNPITHDGKPTKLPLSLFFMTDPRNSNNHGYIHYDSTGKVQKAELFFGCGSYTLYYDTIDSEFILARVEDVSRTTIYKGHHLLERDAILVKTEKDYAWIQTNLPENCPATITSYRRMKTQNTKSYQQLKEKAAALGRDI
jgi:hypothetical protein